MQKPKQTKNKKQKQQHESKTTRKINQNLDKNESKTYKNKNKNERICQWKNEYTVGVRKSKLIQQNTNAARVILRIFGF